MNKKITLLLISVTSLVAILAAFAVTNNKVIFTKATPVPHEIHMTTSNTTVFMQDDYYLNMSTYTTNGNEFGNKAEDSSISAPGPIECNTEDALFEVVTYDDDSRAFIFVSFEFNLDINEAKNITATATYKTKQNRGQEGIAWDATERTLDSYIVAENNEALVEFTLDLDNSVDIYAVKFLSFDFTYSCSY